MVFVDELLRAERATLNASTRAAVLVGYGQPLEIQRYSVPSTLEPGAARVRITMAGICGTDAHLWRGELPIPLPVILGHESAGVLEQLGSGLQQDWRGQPLKKGDLITWASSISCGRCFYCRSKSQPTRCAARKAYGISYSAAEPPHLRGGYAEQILLREGTAIFRLPDDVPQDALIGAGCALTTAIHGFERAPLTWRDVVVVQGTGPVGIASIAVARDSGASKIIAVGGPSTRLQLAREFGADVTIDIETFPTAAQRRECVLSHTCGYGADLVVECVGRPEAVNEGLDYCRDGAQFLILGQYGNAGDIRFNPHTVTRKQLRMTGSWGFEPRHLSKAIDMLSGGWSSRFARAVSDRFPLERANEALAHVRDWRGTKTALVP